MPEEIEIETKDLQETIDEMREEREERAREARETAWTRWISLSTALLAVIAAVAALQSGTLVNEALNEKNDAVLHQAQASDQWAYYQAKGIKGNGARQTAAMLEAIHAPAPAIAKWKKEADRYKEEQTEPQQKARELEAERNAENEKAKALMDHHHIFAYCVTFTQVAIALSAVAALTRRKPVWYISLLIGVAGLIWFIYGFIQPVKITQPPAAHAAAE
ncbi:MAG TPA: DUF4337 domain-containing protein [Chthonomonadaceae bacterium]|nr:DUF4337 domain-containing protein [Chthonomonadaceae bacterium]